MSFNNHNYNQDGKLTQGKVCPLRSPSPPFRTSLPLLKQSMGIHKTEEWELTYQSLVPPISFPPKILAL